MKKGEVKLIEIEDFGAEFADAVIALAAAVRKTPLTNRALALLLKDKTGVSMTDCLAIVYALPNLSAHYLKQKKINGQR